MSRQTLLILRLDLLRDQRAGIGEKRLVQTAEIQVSPKPDTSNLPKTGDDARPLRLLALCALCTAAFALLGQKRKA